VAATTSPSPTPTPSPSPVTAATVSFKDGGFYPENVVITSAGTVTWKNESDGVHTITPKEIGTFRGTGDVEPTQSSRAVMFSGIGTKEYYCIHHPTEIGTVTVVGE
jgi:plastocyanin